MKSILLISVIVFCFHICKGQEIIEGIGPFKINKTTTSIIDELVKNDGYKVKVIRKAADNLILTTRINKIIREVYYDTTGFYKDQDQFPALYFDNIKSYYIYKYTIAEFELWSIRLIFKNDVLIYYSSSVPAELGDAMALKFGEPERKTDEKEVTCLYKLTGNQVKSKDKTITSVWKNGTISATLTYDDFYDSGCNKHQGYDLVICDQVFMQQLRDKESENIRLLKERRGKDNLKNLKDL